MSPSNRKLDALTTTRFVAALSVVFYHGGDGLSLLGLFPINPLLTSGVAAVNYFFVLSGFVMALAYHRPGQKFDFRSYWMARFSRIYPLYLFSFIIICLYYLEIMGRVGSGKVLSNLLLYQAWIPKYAQSFNFAAWSLSVEAFFYGIFPFLALFAARQSPRRLIWISIGFWLLSQLTHFTLGFWLGPQAHPFLAYFPLFHLNSFFLGFSGGVWYLDEASRHPHKTITNLAWMTLALILAAAALIIVKFHPLPIRPLLFDVGLLAPFFLVFILTLAQDNTPVSKTLSHPWLVLLGDASYALYILHIHVRWFMERALLSRATNLTYGQFFGFLYLPFLFAASILTFLYLERPARVWLRHNMHQVPLMLLDLTLVAGSVWLSFLLLVGSADPLPRAQTYALRIGLGVFFISLLAFRLYMGASSKALIPAVTLGTAVWVAFVYLGARNGWIEVFPRSVLALAAALIFASLSASRFALRRLTPVSASR